MLRLEKTLRPLAGDFMQRIDEQHLTLAGRRFAAIADDDAGLHRRVIKQVRPQAEHRLDPVLLDHSGAHGLLLVTEQHAVRPKNRAPAFRRKAHQNVLPKSIVGPALRRRAEEVAAPFVLFESGPVPLLDGIRRIGQDHVESAQSVAFNVFGIGERIAANDLKILHPMKKQVHPCGRNRRQTS